MAKSRIAFFAADPAHYEKALILDEEGKGLANDAKAAIDALSELIASRFDEER